MPIKIQGDLPVKEILERENIFVMDEGRAVSLIFFTIFRMFHSYFFEVTFTLIIIFGLFGSFVIINTRGEPFTLLRLCP